MSKRILRSISVILVIVFLVSAPVQALAAEARASAWFTGYSASIEASGNGIITIKFRVVGTGTMAKLGVSTIDIYKSNGTFVKTISYTASGNGYMMGYNTAYHSGSVPYSGVPVKNTMRLSLSLQRTAAARTTAHTRQDTKPQHEYLITQANKKAGSNLPVFLSILLDMETPNKAEERSVRRFSFRH